MSNKAGLTSALCYRDPRAALAWLGAAFGFEITVLIEDENGQVAHSQMSFGSGQVMVGSEWSARHKSPASIDGSNTQTVHIQIDSDIDAHCARARAAGATIVAEPETQFYGDRSYRCLDLEGHFWTVGQTVKVVTAEEAASESGLKIIKWE